MRQLLLVLVLVALQATFLFGGWWSNSFELFVAGFSLWAGIGLVFITLATIYLSANRDTGS